MEREYGVTRFCECQASAKLFLVRSLGLGHSPDFATKGLVIVEVVAESTKILWDLPPARVVELLVLAVSSTH